MAHANRLREVMKSQFYPFAEGRGFVRGKTTSIFTVFYKRENDRILAFAVQWDKYGRPRFKINFGELHTRDLRSDEADLEIWQCSSLGRLKRAPGDHLRSWFQLQKPLLQALASFRRFYEPEEVVDHLIAAFPEVEAWWSEQRQGPHLEFLPRAG